MATVSGVWVWNSYPSFGNPSSSSGWHVAQNVNFTCNGSNFSEMTFYGESLIGARNINIKYDESTVYNRYEDRTGEMTGGWTNEVYRTVDFGSTPQTVSDDFFEYLENYATPPAEPVPTPDWANCFVKTASGNKAVEKVWIKQGSSLNVVWEKPVTNTVLGFTGLTNSSGALTWTDDIASLQSSDPYTTTTSGNYVSVTGALDSYFPYNQITEVEDGQGNTFIRFPKCWIKWTNNSSRNINGFQVANYQVDSDYFIPDCFLNPNSVDGTDSYLDYVDIGKYEGSGSSATIYSRSGYTPQVAITRAGSRAWCRVYGSSSNYYNGYQQLDIQMLTFYNFLCMLYYRTANIQTVYVGRTSASSTSNTGSTDGVAGLNGWNTSTFCVKMLGVENPYGNINVWCDGIFFSSTTVYIHRYPTQYADSTTNGITMGYTRPSTSNVYVQSLRQGTSNTTKSAVFCSETTSTSGSYTSDAYYYSSSGGVLDVGGNWGNGINAGLWSLAGYIATSSASAQIGGRLCRRPM